MLVCAYQLRVRLLLGIEARRINCLEATTIALYPNPTHIVPSNAVRVFVKSQQSNRLTSSGHLRSTAVLAYGLLPQLPSFLVVLHLLMSPQQRSSISESLLHCHLVRNDTPSQLPDLHRQPSIDCQLQLRLRQPPTQFEFFDRVMAQIKCQFLNVDVVIPDLPPTSVEQ